MTQLPIPVLKVCPCVGVSLCICVCWVALVGELDLKWAWSCLPLGFAGSYHQPLLLLSAHTSFSNNTFAIVGSSARARGARVSTLHWLGQVLGWSWHAYQSPRSLLNHCLHVHQQWPSSLCSEAGPDLSLLCPLPVWTLLGNGMLPLMKRSSFIIF